MIRQRTIKEKVSCTGVGLHSGRRVRVELLPASENSQILFIRTDKKNHVELKASIACLSDTTLATSLASGVNGSRIQIGTVEHLLAATTSAGIDNLQVLVDGDEIPILDGSAAPFIEMLAAAGIEEQRCSKRFIVIKREVKVQHGNKFAKLSPGPGLCITCSLDFDHPLIAPTPLRFNFTEANFRRELMRARTFGFVQDVEALKAKGLARGASLENAIAIDGYRVLNPEGLRYPDEFVRHKILDAIGDLSLFGMPVIGKLTLQRPGHTLNTQLVRAVLADPRNYEIVEAVRQSEQVAALGEGAFALFEPYQSIA
ncbi:MAG: UDP-3-O-acyl-N-acetylglucosamine deacetylase [Deltaproteobacteria bacterium]|nr:UDP-3-O-acyl-N-acetylglucosamine deacetylase [Deltaproteobacteria bacterium]